MKIKIYTDTVDYLSTNLLVLPFFNDRLPLKGNIGFVDWRLNGFISRLYIDGKIRGQMLEKILVPPFSRIPADRVLLVSLGPSEDFAAGDMADFSFMMMETAHKIGFSSFVISLPLEMEELGHRKALFEACFKGIDKFAGRTGPCDFLENLRITFALDRQRNPETFDSLSKFLSHRSSSSQALINI